MLLKLLSENNLCRVLSLTKANVEKVCDGSIDLFSMAIIYLPLLLFGLVWQ